MNIITKKDKLIFSFFAIAVFLFMFVWFDCIHPIVILDSDDWQYISYARPAIPYTGFWNPSRILPETLMPACGSIAASIFQMGLLGYIESQILVFAIVGAAFVAFYIISFGVLVKKKFSLSMSSALLLSIFFLLLHFLVFRTAKENNMYMFWSYDASCFFYYTIPSLLCCALVMYFESSQILENFFSRDKIFEKSVVVVLVYFAIFSNLFNSAILAIYISFEVLRKRKIFSAYSAIVVLWGIAMIFEVLGGRAAASSGSTLQLKSAFSNLLADFKSISIPLKALMIVIIGTAFVSRFILRKNVCILSKSLVSHLFAFVLISIFEVLLCAKVNPAYMLRPQVFFGIAFSLFMMTCLCFAYLLKQYHITNFCMPLLLIVMISITNTQKITFAESNTMNLPWRTCVKINNDIISQVVAADKAGQSEMILDVMDTGYDDNWPHTTFSHFGIEQSLYKHRVINNPIEITVNWSREFNDRNGLNITEFSEDRYY